MRIRSEQIPRLIVLGLLIAGSIVPAPTMGSTHVAGVPALCLFHNITGLPCAGCGMTRSIVCCLHGQFAAASAFHPLGVVVLACLIGYLLTGLPVLRRFDLPSSWKSSLAYIGVAALFLLWVVRLLKILPPPP